MYKNSITTPLPIGFDKTISPPFIVALMTDLLDIEPHDTVLEVGTGLGYQAAIDQVKPGGKMAITRGLATGGHGSPNRERSTK